jgi:hypothetical protein
MSAGRFKSSKYYPYLIGNPGPAGIDASRGIDGGQSGIYSTY